MSSKLFLFSLEVRVVVLAVGLLLASRIAKVADLLRQKFGTIAASGEAVQMWAEVLNSAVSSLAIVAAGYWTYKRFVEGRLGVPKAVLQNTIEVRPCTPKLYWIHVEVNVTNKGETIIPLLCGYCRIRKCLPPSPEIVGHLEVNPEGLFENPAGCLDDGLNSLAEVSWPEIAKSKEWNYKPGYSSIEPGESECFRCDFFIPKDIELIYIESFFRDESKPEVGWNRVSIVEVSPLKSDNSASEEANNERQECKN